MIDVNISTVIDAPPDAVWRTLIDLSRFHEWNPFIRSASGKPAVGAKILVRARTSLPFLLVFRPEVTVCEENRELRWRGSFLHPWLGAGEHSFTLEPQDGGRTRLVHRELFTGLLPPLLERRFAPDVRRGFLAMNQALKVRVERARPAPIVAPARAASRP